MGIKIKKLLQIGLLVENVDEMVKFYEENLGIGGWEVNNSSPDGLTLNGVSYTESPLRIAITKAFGMEFELIQPLQPCPQKDWVDKHGSGLHHLAVETEEGYAEVRQFAEEAGSGTYVRGQGMGGLMDYSYLDFSKQAGLYFECYKFIAPGRTGIPIDYPGENASNVDSSMMPPRPAED